MLKWLRNKCLNPCIGLARRLSLVKAGIKCAVNVMPHEQSFTGNLA